MTLLAFSIRFWGVLSELLTGDLPRREGFGRFGDSPALLPHRAVGEHLESLLLHGDAGEASEMVATRRSYIEPPGVHVSEVDLIVPDDFPASTPAPFALGGVRLKMSLTRGTDDRLYATGTDPGRRLQRYRECLEEVEWAVELLRGKLLKPKYQALERNVILRSLGVNLVRDRRLSEREAEWVLQKIARRLVWPR
ncbi:MAG: hypothetical protein M3N82_05890 [Pseudomonadota bacterium]|nr:hypothetical protein [Pseudomonadota bacterium]